MKKYFNFILFLIFFGFNFVFNVPKILGACNKNSDGLSGGTSSGVTCVDNGSSCSTTCNTSDDWVDRSCNSDETYEGYSQYRCYKNDANCNNYIYCNKCVEKTCETCPSGKTPSNFCYSPSVCSNNIQINSGLSGCSDYYCCDCKVPAQCTSNAQCNDYSSCTTDTCSGGTCSNTDNGTCDEEPPPDDECIPPHCEDSGYHFATNCRGDCETMNHWVDTEYYVCCASGYNYICDGWCYPDQTYGNCSYCNGPCRNEECPTTCHANDLFVPDGSQSDGQCKLEYCPSTPPIYGAPGTCGTANGQIITKQQDLNNFTLCGDGEGASIPSCTTTICRWACFGSDIGNCTGGPRSVGCSAVVNSPPTFQGLVLKNNTSQIVPAQIEIGVGTSRNHICQTDFNGSLTINVTVSATDPDGLSDINDIQLKWNNITFTRNSLTNGVANFSYTFNSGQYDNGTYPFLVNIIDKANNSTGWLGSYRYFKFWDCKVPISGTIYDGTSGSNCGTGEGFSTSADPAVLNFSSLVFTGGGVGVNMTTINSPNYASTNYLTWGVNTYIPGFNTDISLTNPKLRFKTSPTGSWNCPTNPNVDTTGVDPYSTDAMMITADFSGILIQDPWWQADGGGVISNTSVKGRVPATCTETNNCVSQISIGGLVAALTVENKGKSLNSAQDWYYSNTNAKLADYNTNYDYFYSQYFVKKAVGITFSTDDKNISDIGTTGIYFIKGNLTIDTDKTLTNPGDFLMIIVKGNITVDQTVNTVDGILIANDINASGSSLTPLTFNGSLYASNNVNFSRDFDTRLDNNTKPAIVVNYDPELIFNMPGDIAKVLTNWQWGN